MTCGCSFFAARSWERCARHAQPGEWRTNVSLGGGPSHTVSIPRPNVWPRPPPRAIGAEMAGVDLITDLDLGRLVVLEVNAVPGWRALARVTGIDVAAEIMAALKEMGR